MKKRVIYILVTCLLLSLAGCKAQPGTAPNITQTNDAITESSNSETTVSTEDVPVQQQPMVAVSVPVITQTEKAEDGTELFTYKYQNISLIVPDPEVADKVIVDFLNRTDIHEDIEQIFSLSKQAYADKSIPFTTYWVQNTYDPMRIDHGVLSLYGNYAAYSGGAHGTYTYKSVNYDLVTGSALFLGDILTEAATSDQLCQLVLTSLSAQKEDAQLFEGFESIVTNLFSQNFLQNDDWFFSNTGLCFFFSPYEIGPFSSGDIVAEIPYASLTGLLNDAYFPAERESAHGVVQAEVFDETALDRFTQFAEVVLAEGSNKTLLYTDKSLYDIRVETGTWSANGSTFTPDHTVLAAYSLTPGDAIMIDAVLSNTLPTLRLSYTTGEDTVISYIGFDATANAVILSEG